MTKKTIVVKAQGLMLSVNPPTMKGRRPKEKKVGLVVRGEILFCFALEMDRWYGFAGIILRRAEYCFEAPTDPFIVRRRIVNSNLIRP